MPLSNESIEPEVTTLLLVDVQKDFHSGGSLEVCGSDIDAERIACLVRRHSKRLHRIVATLDSHYKLHIAHPSFWVDGESQKLHPPPFTIVSADDIRIGKWIPRGDIIISACMVDPSVFIDMPDDMIDKHTGKMSVQKYCHEYARRLENAGRFQICIWPEHCLIGSPGHAMVDTVFRAVNEWSDQTGRSVEWIMKGQNLFTEMYSALAADVPVSVDTCYNEALQESLLKSDKLLVCGQALSHCVNYTMRDIVRNWPISKLKNICLLEDCTSTVSGFENAAQTFVSDMIHIGVRIKKSTDDDLFG
jgi:nicotinamidase/pyrazinamidase